MKTGNGRRHQLYAPLAPPMRQPRAPDRPLWWLFAISCVQPCTGPPWRALGLVDRQITPSAAAAVFGRLAVLWPLPVVGWAGRGCPSSRRPTYGHVAANQSPNSGARTPSSAGVSGFPQDSVCDACTFDLRVRQGPTHMAAIGLLSGHICVSYRARVACPPTQCPNPCTAPWNSRAAPIPGQIWPLRQHQQQSHVR